MQGPIDSTNFQYSSRPDNRYPLSLPVDYPLLAQKEQMNWQLPIANVQQYGRAWPALPTALDQPLGVDDGYHQDYSLLERKEQVGWQPPVPNVQKYGSARPAPTTALDQPSGLNTVNYRPTMENGVVARYSASPAFPSRDAKLVVHTHASHSNKPVSEFIGNNCEDWTLTLDIPIPEDVVRPTLTSFSYTVKYSTANDHLASVVRSNIMLATAESEKLDDEETSEGADAVCLSSVLGIKANQLDNQWNHFVDHHHIPFNVRVVPSSRLYLQIHVLEYPTEAILRSLSMDVFATWLVDQEEMRLLQKRQAKMRADEAKAKAAEEEQARLAAEAQKAAEAERARLAAEAQRAAEEEKARQAAEAQKAADEELARQAAEAQKAADEELARLAAEAQKAADEPDANVGKPADEEMQEKIRKALERLPADRKCPAGYAWVQNSTGFTCGGAHSITWEELDALADSGGLDGSDDDGTEEL